MGRTRLRFVIANRQVKQSVVNRDYVEFYRVSWVPSRRLQRDDGREDGRDDRVF